MLGWWSIEWILIYLDRWETIFSDFTFYFAIFLRATTIPVSHYRPRNTSPNLPYPILFPTSNPYTTGDFLLHRLDIVFTITIYSKLVINLLTGDFFWVYRGFLGEWGAFYGYCNKLPVSLECLFGLPWIRLNIYLKLVYGLVFACVGNGLCW